MTGGLPEGTVTVLVVDIADSTELTNQLGDRASRDLLRRTEELVREQVRRHRGVEVKGTGDGLMLAFQSARRAVLCAADIQRGNAGRFGVSPGLGIRIGLHTGEVIHEDMDLFGAAVTLAFRIQEQAAAGQILLSETTRSLLGPDAGVGLADFGARALKGFAQPVQLHQVEWQPDEQPRPSSRSPFVGRATELAKLQAALSRTRSGTGGLVMLVGEPGIGKTRTIDEFCATARREGVTVLVGRCYEGDWVPPYNPFLEALAAHVREAERGSLREDLGYGAATLARLVPSIGLVLPDLPAPAPLQPDEERFRILDATNQFLNALSKRAPVVLVLDDLHWADASTLEMLRHIARAAPRERLLILGAYRDVELDRAHRLAATLRELRREAEYERIQLGGLGPAETERLLTALAQRELPDPLVRAVAAETDGNPFFVREMLLHLMERGWLRREDSSWRTGFDAESLDIPQGVREVVRLRLSRLSETANNLLVTASAFSGSFRFDVVMQAAGLDEAAALDGLDEALEAQVLRPTEATESYEFTHAIIRHTLYSELSPSRQIRLHRTIAQTLEEIAGSGAEQAADLAHHYYRSAALSGSERGAGYALLAAEHAQSRYAWEQAAGYFRMAEELLPHVDERRLQLLWKLAQALAWSLQGEEAAAAAGRAAAVAANNGQSDVAADILADVALVLANRGFWRDAWALAKAGLSYLRDERRDATWVILHQLDLNSRRGGDPAGVGTLTPTAEQDRILAVLDELPAGVQGRVRSGGVTPAMYADRKELLASNDPLLLVLQAGTQYRRHLPALRKLATETEERGELTMAILASIGVAEAHAALGEFGPASAALSEGLRIAERLPPTAVYRAYMLLGETMMVVLTGSFGGPDAESIEFRWRELVKDEGNQYLSATARAEVAYLEAHRGEATQALQLIGETLPAMERIVRRTVGLPNLFYAASAALFVLDRADFAPDIERDLLVKWLPDGHHHPHDDPRLALARLCAVQRRMDEAHAWFARAREVFDAEEMRPMRAICDYDEALALVRANSSKTERVSELLDGAEELMEQIGMPGWLRSAQELRASSG